MGNIMEENGSTERHVYRNVATVLMAKVKKVNGRFYQDKKVIPVCLLREDNHLKSHLVAGGRLIEFQREKSYLHQQILSTKNIHYGF